MARYTKQEISEYYAHHLGRGKTKEQITNRLRGMMQEDPESFGAEEANMIFAIDRGEATIPSVSPEVTSAAESLSGVQRAAQETQPLSNLPSAPYVGAMAPIVGGAAWGGQAVPYAAQRLLPGLAKFLGPKVLQTLGMITGGAAGRTAKELTTRRFEGGPLSAEDVKESLRGGLETGAIIGAPEIAGEVTTSIAGPTLGGLIARLLTETGVGVGADIALAPRKEGGMPDMSQKQLALSLLTNLMGGVGGGTKAYFESAGQRVPPGMVSEDNIPAIMREGAKAPDLRASARLIRGAPEAATLMEASAPRPQEAELAESEVSKYITGRPLQPEAETSGSMVRMTEAIQEAATGKAEKILSNAGMSDISQKEFLSWLQEMESNPEGLRAAMDELGQAKTPEEVGTWFSKKMGGIAAEKMEKAKVRYGLTMDNDPRVPVLPEELASLDEQMQIVLDDSASILKQVESGVMGKPRGAAKDISEVAKAGGEDLMKAQDAAMSAEDAAMSAERALEQSERFGGFPLASREDVAKAWEDYKSARQTVAKIMAGNEVNTLELKKLWRDLNSIPVRTEGRPARGMEMIRNSIDSLMQQKLTDQDYMEWKNANLEYGAAKDSRKAAVPYTAKFGRGMKARREIGEELIKELGQPGGQIKGRQEAIGVTDSDIAEIAEIAKQGAIGKVKTEGMVGRTEALSALKRMQANNPTPEFARAIEALERQAKESGIFAGKTKTMLPNRPPNTPEGELANQAAETFFSALRNAPPGVRREADQAILAEFTRLVSDGGPVDITKVDDFINNNRAAMKNTDAGKVINMVRKALSESAVPADLAKIATVFSGSEFPDILRAIVKYQKNTPKMWKTAYDALDTSLGAEAAKRVKEDFAQGLLGVMAKTKSRGKIDVRSFADELNRINPETASVIFGYDPATLRRFNNGKKWFPIIADSLDKVAPNPAQKFVFLRRLASTLGLITGAWTGGTAIAGLGASALLPDLMLNIVMSDKMPELAKALQEAARKVRVGRATVESMDEQQ